MVETCPDWAPSLIVSLRRPSAFPELACRLMVTPSMLRFSFHLTALCLLAAPRADDSSWAAPSAGDVVLVVLAGVVVTVVPVMAVVVVVVPIVVEVVVEFAVVDVVVELGAAAMAPAGSAITPRATVPTTAPTKTNGDARRTGGAIQAP
jgi:hypothetical protein